jgi:hypothetical protein
MIESPTLFGGRAKRGSLNAGEAAARQAAQQVAHKARYRQLAREITPIPAVLNPLRRAQAESSLEFFLRTYFPNRFPLAWSPDHLKAIAQIEEATRSGGLYALAMPRGRGKTTICEVAILWGALNGFQEFGLLLGATSGLATKMLASIKSELLGNELLYEDFPEVIHPIREADGNPHRCMHQVYQGKKTKLEWKQKLIVLPRIPGSKASEVVIAVSGLTGAIRGLKHARSDGVNIRPTIVLIDDPQTNKTAKSDLQCDDRLLTLNGTVMNLAGPGKKIACVCTCTIIRDGDVASRLLNREQSPNWKGQTFRALDAFPERMDLWNQYQVLRAESFRADGDGGPAREFYRDNRAEMDRGAIVTWPENVGPGDLSALETLMKRFFDDEESFWAEFQNAPKKGDVRDSDITVDDVVGRFSGRKHFVVPVWATKLTAFVDVQKKLLFGMVVAWDESSFTGAVIDYSTWPKQRGRRYFNLSNVQTTIQTQFRGKGLEAQIRLALEAYTPELLCDYKRDDGVQMKVDRLLIDSSFEMDTVFEFCRTTPNSAIIMPSRGVGIGAKDRPMSEWPNKPGEKKGFHWLIGPQLYGRRHIRWLKVDVNYWKSFVAQRIKQEMREPGALTFFGGSRNEANHELLADHFCAEQCHKEERAGRVVDEWAIKVGNPDNHWWDCVVGCAAAASAEGCSLAGTTRVEPRKRQKFKSYDEWKASRFGSKA